jgi:hypothetical protein
MCFCATPSFKVLSSSALFSTVLSSKALLAKALSLKLFYPKHFQLLYFQLLPSAAAFSAITIRFHYFPSTQSISS